MPNMIIRVLVIILLLPFLAPASLHAITLDAAAWSDIRRIETYLNGLTTLKARFVQRTDKGQVDSGMFYLSRPGKMRFEYDPPSPILLVADGLFLIYVDHNLQQISHVLLSSTPASVLLADVVTLTEKHDVIAFDRGESQISIGLAEKDDPDKGSIRFYFSERPLRLRHWLIRDAQNVEVSVSLFDSERGTTLAAELFHVDPNLFDQSDRNN